MAAQDDANSIRDSTWITPSTIRCARSASALSDISATASISAPVITMETACLAGPADGEPGTFRLILVELLEQRAVQVRLAGEMVVQAADAGPGPSDYLHNAGLRVADGRENLASGREQRAPGCRTALRRSRGRRRLVSCHPAQQRS